MPKKFKTKKTAKKTHKQPSRLKTKRFWKWLLKFSLLSSLYALVFGSILAFFVISYYSRGLPDITEMAKNELKPTVAIRDQHGVILAKYGDLKGDTLTYSQIPTNMVNAVVATEDQNFFDHGGIDPFGILRAQLVNMRAGRVVQGGSTITQQLAKVIYLSPERTLKRKVQELIIAYQLEKNFTKEQIISMYLNRVYLGRGNYGIDAAAKFYFGKSAEDLDLFESAIFAAMLKAPSRYAPSNNFKLAVNRAHYVLARMEEEGFITKHEREKARPPVVVARGTARGALTNPYFADYVLAELYDVVEASNEELDVYTTLDLSAQDQLEKSLQGVMSEAKKSYNAHQAAAILMENNGAIKAMMGGVSYQESQYNRATNSKRQPGSAFKFFTYAAAMERGKELSDVYDDKPIYINQGRNLPLWSPRNFSRDYVGQVDLEKAFAKSINTVAVQLSEEIGRDASIEMAHRLGVKSSMKPLASIALGVTEMSLLELTQSIAHIANDGNRVRAFAITKVTNKKGDVIFERVEHSEDKVLSDSTVAKMKSLMTAVVDYGTGRKAHMFLGGVYGKTGTTQEHRDAWFVGVKGDMLMGVWVGNDDDSAMNKVTGGTLPAAIWKEFFSNVSSIEKTVLSNDSLPWSQSVFDVLFSNQNSEENDEQ